MLECNAVYESLSARGIDFFVGVPDSLLKNFCAYITDHTSATQHVIAANEGGAIALAAGHYLATGRPALVYMQNSGLGNTVNPLTSLTDPEVYGIPMLLVIGWRGEPGVKDAPQHVKMGRVTLATLETLGISHAVLPDEPGEAEAAIAEAMATMEREKAPYALVVKKGTFGSYKLRKKDEHAHPMTREQALARLLRITGNNAPDAVVVSTTGMPSREVFELRDRRGEGHERDFLTVGSMGHSSQIALGVALARPERKVVCIDGDGALLMHMGGLATVGSLAPKNFVHVVLNNGAHDSVGGQPTAGFTIDMCALATACGYRAVLRAEDENELHVHGIAILCSEGPSFLEVRVATGARPDLGRPTLTPGETKTLFMNTLKS